MNLFDINRKVILFTLKIINILLMFRYYCIDFFKWKKILKKNKLLKNRHLGERCYIVGNGPSLAKVDLAQLAGKHVITVNLSINTATFDVLDPDYHIILDRARLADAKGNIAKSISKKRRTNFILHRAAYDVFENKEKIFYGYATRMLTSENLKSDMTGNTSTFLNVLPYAVLCAIYMGFKEIILLGNDFSFFAARRDLHFYDMDQNVKRTESLYQDLSGCAIVLLQYRFLYKYALKNGIRIENATEGSLLDEIPQVNLKDVLKREECKVK